MNHILMIFDREKSVGRQILLVDDILTSANDGVELLNKRKHFHLREEYEAIADMYYTHTRVNVVLLEKTTLEIRLPFARDVSMRSFSYGNYVTFRQKVNGVVQLYAYHDTWPTNEPEKAEQSCEDPKTILLPITENEDKWDVNSLIQKIDRLKLKKLG